MKAARAAGSALSPTKPLTKVAFPRNGTHRLKLTRTPATAAMNAMNGVQLGSKPIIVRLHEPKQFRQEKLALRFQGNGHPRSASGATSPTHSEGGDSFAGWSPRRASSVLASPGMREQQLLDRGRRGSSSYYQV